jgi:outer membrane protein insertion porin family
MAGTDSVYGKQGRWNSKTLWIFLGALIPFFGPLVCIEAQQMPQGVGSPGFAPQRPGAATPDQIVDVRVVGNHKIPEQLILSNVQTRIGNPYNHSITQADCSMLVQKLPYFQDVRANVRSVGQGQVAVEFVVVEHLNLIQDVILLNARHLKKDDVYTLKQIRKWSPLNPLLNKKAAKDIEMWYHMKGRLFAVVNIEEGDKATDKRVVFNVTEGPPVKIRSVQFTGNETLASQARLRTQINSKAALFRILGGTYDQNLIDADVLKLRDYYRDNGYHDVEISRELMFSADLAWVDVIFHIREGTRYHVGEVGIAGNKNFSKEELASILKVKTGETYNKGKIDVDIQNLKDYNGWRGYKVHAIENLVAADQPGVVNVQYEVIDSPRPPARVGEIIIVGNTITKEHVIRRALGLYPGQVLRYPELRFAEAMLNRLNLFENNPELGIRPTVTVIEDGTNSEYKNVLVQVKETYTGSLMFGLGVNSDAGLVGNIVLNERNFDLFRPPLTLDDIFEGKAFRGGGQEFRLEAVPGTQLQRYTASFREPFLFDRPYSLTLAGYYYNRMFAEYTEGRIGGRVTVGHQFNRFWSVSGGVRVEAVEVDDVPFYAPDDYLDVVGQNFLIAPRLTVTRDSRDSFLRPTDGSMVQASAEYAFGDFNYPVLNVEASKFFTTWQRRDGSGKHVLAAHGQVSWAGDEVPVYERFFAGGFRSLRGFDFRGVGPVVDGFRVGGDFMMLASLEYQIPVKANDQIYLVAFLDTGTVERDVNITDYRVSAGLGARIVVPMMGPVPIALDFGFPIVKGPMDDERIFSFYVGLQR